MNDAKFNAEVSKQLLDLAVALQREAYEYYKRSSERYALLWRNKKETPQ